MLKFDKNSFTTLGGKDSPIVTKYDFSKTKEEKEKLRLVKSIQNKEWNSRKHSTLFKDTNMGTCKLIIYLKNTKKSNTFKTTHNIVCDCMDVKHIISTFENINKVYCNNKLLT